MLGQYILPFLFFVAIAIQVFYILAFFTRLTSHINFEPNIQDQPKPSVSIIVAAWNELDNLKELLPLLEAQDYPNFEIVVADDRSSDGTYDYLLTNEGGFKKVIFTRINSLPDHFTAKKYAVTMAIKKSKNEVILLTDADCRPVSNLWLATMIAQLTSEKDVVLGFSPYHYDESRLNALIRYETFQTAVQYFSFALAKVPYMGVGRNLMYRKELFWKKNGFASHLSLLSGDDDLFINEAETKTNVAICTNPDTYIYSEPKKTWADWKIQKQRHLSVGKKYKLRDKFLLGLLWLSHLTCWFFFVPTFFIKPDWFEAPEWSRISADLLDQYHLQDFYLYNDWMRLITGGFFAWLLLRWIVLAMVNKKLGKTISSWKIPYHDFLYALYLLVLGLITTLSKPKKIKWR